MTCRIRDHAARNPVALDIAAGAAVIWRRNNPGDAAAHQMASCD
jgi:hypothetical protein